jgi:hypothetical protein
LCTVSSPICRTEVLQNCLQSVVLGLRVSRGGNCTYGAVRFSEIRALKDQHRDAHIAARDRQQKLLDAVVEECVADGSFTTEFPRDASRAITTICTGVSQWYRAGGELDPAGVAERYGEICAHAAGLPVK